jgi:hypothetical protein
MKSGHAHRTIPIVAIIFAACLLPSRVEAFALHDQYWFEVFLLYGFDFGDNGNHRFGLGMEVSPPNTEALLGGTVGIGTRSWHQSMPDFDATFDVGYCLGLDPVKPIAVPAFAKLGLVDSTFGLVLAGGVQGLVPAHLGWNLNLQGLGTLRLRPFASGRDTNTLSTGLDFGLGFATLQGKSSGGGGYTVYYY